MENGARIFRRSYAIVFVTIARESLRFEQLAPDHDDYIVLKPKHSAFFATPLETLLEYLGVKSVILTGFTTNACVLITASDVYVRDLQLFVPSDCVAALTDEDQQSALEMMRRNFAVDIRPSTELRAFSCGTVLLCYELSRD